MASAEFVMTRHFRGSQLESEKKLADDLRKLHQDAMRDPDFWDVLAMLRKDASY